MNDLSTSLTHFISLLLVVDLTETWFLEDMVETIFKDFLRCPGVTKRSVKCQVSKILVKLFGENVKGQGRGRKRFYKTASYNEVLGFVDRLPSGSKVCFFVLCLLTFKPLVCCWKWNVVGSFSLSSTLSLASTISKKKPSLRSTRWMTFYWGIQEKSLLTTNVSSKRKQMEWTFWLPSTPGPGWGEERLITPLWSSIVTTWSRSSWREGPSGPPSRPSPGWDVSPTDLTSTGKLVKWEWKTIIRRCEEWHDKSFKIMMILFRNILKIYSLS